MPLWLLVLRLLLAALLIIGLAHPLINPARALPGTGPLLLVVDDGWASAPDWRARMRAAADLLARAGREGREAALVTTAPGAAVQAPAVEPPSSIAVRLDG